MRKGAIVAGALCLSAALAVPPAVARAQPATDDEAIACLIRPRDVIELSTPVEGVIESVAVDRGDNVRRGDLIATLESRIEQADLALADLRAKGREGIDIARAQADLAAKRHARMRELDQHVSRSEMDEVAAEAKVADLAVRRAETEHQLAQLDLAREQALLERRTIHSPVDGVIVDRLMAPGEFRNEQAHVVTIAQLDPLHVELHAPISWYGTIVPGDIAEIRPEAPIGGRYSATVTVVDRVFDSASGTFGVRLELPNPDRSLPAGLHCTASFPVS